MSSQAFNTSERRLVVGIDFGTTYSGIAWAETTRANIPSAITTWPVSRTNLEGASSDKVPSKLRYSGNRIEWGFSIPSMAQDVIEWWKLDLDPTLDRLEKSEENSTVRGSKTADVLTSDFLGLLLEHLMYTLREKLGEGIVSSIPFEFVLTVPAIWSDAAKDKTHLALLNSLILRHEECSISLVSEPEAAAMYSFSKLDTHGLQVGDGVVLVDAGGGTVDLISYKLAKLNPALEVEEAAEGSGGLCGSTFLNNRFELFLKSKLAGQPGFDDDVLAEAMEAFETRIKRLFTTNTDPDEKFAVPVGGVANNPAIGVARGRFSVRATDLTHIFEPVVTEIIQLVQDQIQKSSSQAQIKAVLLVGGFGASVYLKEKLRHALSGSIKVLQPPYAWQAVVNGAVMKGLASRMPGAGDVKVLSRKARHSYGVSMNNEFVEHDHKHLEHTKWWSKRDGHYRVDAMHWFVKRGQQLKENSPVVITYTSRNHLVANGHPKIFTLPVQYDKLQRQLPSMANQKDEHIVEIVTLQADISAIPESELPRRYFEDGILRYDIHLSVEAIFLSASIAFSLRFKGKQYKTVTCEYK